MEKNIVLFHLLFLTQNEPGEFTMNKNIPIMLPDAQIWKNVNCTRFPMGNRSFMGNTNSVGSSDNGNMSRNGFSMGGGSPFRIYCDQMDLGDI